MVQNRQKVALGQDKQKAYIILNGNFIGLSCPNATYALQHGGFVPREWLAAKGLLRYIGPNVSRVFEVNSLPSCLLL